MAYDFIRDAIVSGGYHPGEKVDQDEIAAVLGISRLPVREALIELSQKGFVESIPRRGAFVAELQTEDIDDHFESLGLLFSMAARRAAQDVDPETVSELERLHARINTLEPNDSDARIARDLSLQFVNVLTRAGSSRQLRTILRFLSATLPGSYYTESSAWGETEFRFRERMLETLASHDADAAAELAVERLQNCRRLTLEVLRERDYWRADERAARAEA